MGVQLSSVDALLGKPKIRIRLGAWICAVTFLAPLALYQLMHEGGALWSVIAVGSLGVCVVTALLLDSYFTLGLLACVASPLTYGCADSLVTGSTFFVAVLAVGAACMMRSFKWHAQRTAVRSPSERAAERTWITNLVAWAWFSFLAVNCAIAVFHALAAPPGAAMSRLQEPRSFEVMAYLVTTTSWLLLLTPLLASRSGHGRLAAALGRCAVVLLSFVLTDLATALQQQSNLKPGAGVGHLHLSASMWAPLSIWGLWFAIDAAWHALRLRDKRTLLLLACFAAFCAATTGFSFKVFGFSKTMNTRHDEQSCETRCKGP